MTLKQTQKIINNQFFKTVMQSSEQPFYYFISTHPTLYDGLEIDTKTINLINDYFFEYNVNPLHFEHRFKNILKLELARYNNISKIELSNKILQIFTKRKSKKFIENILNGNLKIQKNVTEQVENKAEMGTSTTASISSSEDNTKTSNKQATKDLPFNSNGDDFDSIVDWSSGATAVNETENKNNSTSLNNTNYNTNNTNSLADSISKEDLNKLSEFDKKLLSNEEAETEIHGQAVDLINKIINYLYEPKAINYLIEKLKIAFIQVY